MSTILNIENLTVGYGSKSILKGFSASVKVGEVVALIGPNGAGKSTLLHTLLGIEKPLLGTIHFFGKPLEEWSHSERATRMSALLTEAPSHGAWLVKEMLALGFQKGILSDQERSEWIETLKLEELLPQRVSRLSSGEAQRVMLLRCLSQAKELWLMDEPTANLDPGTSALVMRDLKRKTRDQQSSLIFSTHDLSTAISYADHLWICHEGRVEVCGTDQQELSTKFEVSFGQPGLRFDRDLMRFVSE